MSKIFKDHLIPCLTWIWRIRVAQQVTQHSPNEVWNASGTEDIALQNIQARSRSLAAIPSELPKHGWFSLSFFARDMITLMNHLPIVCQRCHFYSPNSLTCIVGCPKSSWSIVYLLTIFCLSFVVQTVLKLTQKSNKSVELRNGHGLLHGTAHALGHGPGHARWCRSRLGLLAGFRRQSPDGQQKSFGFVSNFHSIL